MARMKFLIVTVVLMGVEIYLMLYCKDEFAKTYLAAGVIVLAVCTFFYILVPEGFWMLPFLVAIAFTGLEMMKYFGLYYDAHLYRIPFLRAIIGSTYDFKRIVAYFVGAAMAVAMSRVSAEN